MSFYATLHCYLKRFLSLFQASEELEDRESLAAIAASGQYDDETGNS